MTAVAVKRKPWIGNFLAALVLSLCVLGFGLACLVIECNMQRATTGRVELNLAYRLEEGIPRLYGEDGKAITVVPDAWQEAVLLSADGSRQLTLALLSSQMSAAIRLWEMLLPK